MPGGAAIVGIGVHLPPLRGNDWWSPEVVRAWQSRGLPPRHIAPTTLAGDLAWKHFLALVDDPFQGCVSRPVMPADTSTADMELAAARQAVEVAQIGAHEIDCILQMSSGDRDLLPRNAFFVHAGLGLRGDTLTLGVDADSMSFHAQLAVADGLLRSGVGQTALLLQSWQRTHAVDGNSPFSVTVGDGATAAVVRLARAPEAGLRGSVFQTDTSKELVYYIGTATGPWWGPGEIMLRVPDPGRLLARYFQHPDRLIEAVSGVLAKVGLSTDDVDFLSTHQGAAWFQDVVREGAGLTRARTIDTFRTTASVGACNVPLALARAVEAGLITNGDRVVIASGGAADVWGAAVLVWEGP